MKFVRKLTLPTLLLALVAALPALAQGPIPFPPGLAKKLAARASNYSEVTLNKHSLNLASQFMSKDKKSGQQLKRLMQNLNGIYIREYDFAKPGHYSIADLDRIRANFKGPEWVPMIQSRSHSKDGVEISDIYQKVVHGDSEGMLILDAEPKELDFVYISGHINISDLGDLGGLGALGGKLGAAEAHSQPQLHTRAKPDHNSDSHSGSNPGTNQ